MSQFNQKKNLPPTRDQIEDKIASTSLPLSKALAKVESKTEPKMNYSGAGDPSIGHGGPITTKMLDKHHDKVMSGGLGSKSKVDGIIEAENRPGVMTDPHPSVVRSSSTPQIAPMESLGGQHPPAKGAAAGAPSEIEKALGPLGHKITGPPYNPKLAKDLNINEGIVPNHNIPPLGADGVNHTPPLEDDNKTPFYPPIADGPLPPDSPQARHEGGYDFLQAHDPRRGMPKWLNGEELLQYIALAIVDMVEDWRPLKANEHVLEVLQLLMSDLKTKWKNQPHFHPMRSQPIALLQVKYDLMEHADRVLVHLVIELMTPEQKDLKSLRLILDSGWDSELWKQDDISLQTQIMAESHEWSKSLSLDISKPNVARKRILSHSDSKVSVMTLDQAVELLRANKVKGTRDWQIVEPIDGEKYVYSDRSTFTVDEAKLVASTLV